MDQNDIWLTTGEAASLIHVHHSSVKRWCDEQTLPCSHTAGGHRRIALNDLLTLATERKLQCVMLPFGSQAGEVLHGLRQVQDEGDYNALISLVYRWLSNTRPELPSHLFQMVLEERLSMPALFDELIGSVMHRIGDAWRCGEIEVGDEHRMCQMVIDGLYELRSSTLAGREPSQENRSVALVACGEGNQHDIGAQMVRIWLEASGWQTVYLGAQAPTADIAMQQKKMNASLVCISMPPPAVGSDAGRICQILAGLYDARHPYHLALGGRGVQDADLADTAGYPFNGCKVFRSIGALDEWLEPFRITT